MAITLLERSDSYKIFRVTKNVAGKTIQEYVKVKGKTQKAEDRARKEAEERLEWLTARSVASRLLRQTSLKQLIKSDGRILNIHRLITKQPVVMDCFQIYYWDDKAKDQRMTSFAVKKYGDENAFKKAVHFFADQRDMDVKGETVKLLLQQGWAYGVGQRSDDAVIGDAAFAEESQTADELEWARLTAEMEAFKQKKQAEKENARKLNRARRRKSD